MAFIIYIYDLLLLKYTGVCSMQNIKGNKWIMTEKIKLFTFKVQTSVTILGKISDSPVQTEESLFDLWNQSQESSR